MKLTKAQKEILYADFEEIPVDIMTFLTDRRYLGNSWLDRNDNNKMFPFWREQAKKFYPLPMRSPYNILLLAGATGLGKTSFAVDAIMAYYLYVVMCLRDPHEYFDLADQKKITFAFLNIVTKTIAYKNAWGMLHKALLESPWFMERGGRTPSDKAPEWYCKTKPIDLLYGSSPNDLIGLDILACFFDEISFARISDPKRAQEQALDLFNAAYERMTSRYTKFGGIFEGLAIMASSKRTDQAFLEVFTEKILDSSDRKKVFCVDKPRWEVLPSDTYCGEKFPVAVGDKFMPPQIIDETDVKTFEEAGYEVIWPPIETRGAFERNIGKALTDIAGISILNQMTFLRGDKVKNVVNKERQNPFVQSVIYVGTKDQLQYSDFFSMDRLKPGDLKKPLFIHLDASLGGDGNSISGVSVEYARYQVNPENGHTEPMLCYDQVFKIKVKAPKGDKVMLRKNEQFIYWLRSQGFNIAKVTSDQYQSEQFGQDLEHAGFNYGRQSIDRVQNGINMPYKVLKDSMYEERIKILEDEDQTFELVHLQEYENGRIDKPLTEGSSDDAAQALCGAVYAASQCKEEYLANHSAMIMNSDNSETQEDLPDDLVASLIARQFSNDYLSPIGELRMVGNSGLRESFDKVVAHDPIKEKSKRSHVATRFF